MSAAGAPVAFYGGGLGDRLVSPEVYPPLIQRFLADEEAALERACRGMDLLVEVGCMDGRSMDWAVERGLAYLGIDVVERYIAEARERALRRGLSESRCRFLVGASERLPELVDPASFGARPEATLLFFPFNSFGNMDDAAEVLKGVLGTGLPFLISSYPVTPEANACRESYYRNCRYRDLSMVRDDRGVIFLSPDGLRTFAYDETYLLGLCRELGLPSAAVSFSAIGIAYADPRTAERLRAPEPR